MDLLSVFKRRAPAEAVPTPVADAVQPARTRARQRLIGAAVLVIAGIIGFPLLFETQPRPIPVDLPIEIPRKDNVPPLALPSAPAEVPARPAAAPAKPSPPVERVINEEQADAGREVAPAAVGAASAAASEPARPRSPPPSAAPRASAPAAPAPGADDGARAKALLEGKPVPGVQSQAQGRFVVQVGAFTDPVALKEARARVEKLGMKTYTQVAETPAGARTRVRVGPFATRDEAERAAARLKASALPAVILTL